MASRPGGRALGVHRTGSPEPATSSSALRASCTASQHRGPGASLPTSRAPARSTPSQRTQLASLCCSVSKASTCEELLERGRMFWNWHFCFLPLNFATDAMGRLAQRRRAPAPSLHHRAACVTATLRPVGFSSAGLSVAEGPAPPCPRTPPPDSRSEDVSIGVTGRQGSSNHAVSLLPVVDRRPGAGPGSAPQNQHQTHGPSLLATLFTGEILFQNKSLPLVSVCFPGRESSWICGPTGAPGPGGRDLCVATGRPGRRTHVAPVCPSACALI